MKKINKIWVCDFNKTDCILCKTEEQFKLLDYQNNMGEFTWSIFKEDTVFYPKMNNFKGQFSSLKAAKENNDKVYNFEDIHI